MAARKAEEAGLAIQLKQANAEATGFLDGSFDVVTASLLFHETPARVAPKIFQEAMRLLQPGGQVLILDGDQQTLRQNAWLSDIFEEPYIRDYAAGHVGQSLETAGFIEVVTENQWWVNQIVVGRKPLPVQPYAPTLADTHNMAEMLGQLA
jgi:ubiquinone/menaquinone biosynthesis C-methylase UbiE